MNPIDPIQIFYLESRDGIQGRIRFMPQTLAGNVSENIKSSRWNQGMSSKLCQNRRAVSRTNLLILVEFRNVTQCSWEPDTKSDQFLTHSCWLASGIYGTLAFVFPAMTVNIP